MIYALAGAMHGGGKTLTLMADDGAASLATRLAGRENVHLLYYPGSLPLLIEQREGALARIVSDLSVILLDKPDWDRQKDRLGDRIYR